MASKQDLEKTCQKLMESFRSSQDLVEHLEISTVLKKQEVDLLAGEGEEKESEMKIVGYILDKLNISRTGQESLGGKQEK